MVNHPAQTGELKTSSKKTRDGKSYYNPPSETLSSAYDSFIHPIDNGCRGGFDVHIYFYQDNQEQATFAFQLWERIRREFPELRIYKIWDRPVGPHTVAMFEVNIFTPMQFGAFVPWLVVHRGPLSVLLHPNTGDEERDHSLVSYALHCVDSNTKTSNVKQLATWMGQKLPLDLSVFKKMREAQAKLQKLKAAQDDEEDVGRS